MIKTWDCYRNWKNWKNTSIQQETGVLLNDQVITGTNKTTHENIVKTRKYFTMNNYKSGDNLKPEVVFLLQFNL